MIEAVAGLALGLAGSLHCVGMCGPIAIALPGKRKLSWSMGGQKLVYQLGRVTSYTLLGVVAGLAGSTIVEAGFSQHLSVIAGTLMVVMAVVHLGLHKELIHSKLLAKVSSAMESKIGAKLASRKGGTQAHYLIGVLNGLLPCGLVLSALVGSIGTGDVLEGSLFMMMFGLGTVPLMSAVAILGGVISCQLRHKLRTAVPVIAIMIGVVFVLRGLSLGIPYVSPVLHGPKPACCTAN
jgi:uncharacterized protein